MGKMNTLDWISFVLLVIGGLNWGLVGLLGFDLVAAIFGTSILATIVYLLVGLSALYAIYHAATTKKGGGGSAAPSRPTPPPPNPPAGGGAGPGGAV